MRGNGGKFLYLNLNEFKLQNGGHRNTNILSSKDEEIARILNGRNTIKSTPNALKTFWDAVRDVEGVRDKEMLGKVLVAKFVYGIGIYVEMYSMFFCFLCDLFGV